MRDESGSGGAPWSWQYEVTSKLEPEARTATFPTVYGADVTMTTVGDPLVGRFWTVATRSPSVWRVVAWPPSIGPSTLA